MARRCSMRTKSWWCKSLKDRSIKRSWQRSLNSSDAASCERGAVQAFELVARWTNGEATVETSRVKNATVTTLALPKESPFHPAVARLNDIVLISTNAGLNAQKRRAVARRVGEI